MLMTKEVLNAFASCRRPTIASCAMANAQLRPILEAAAQMQQQVAVHRANLLAAELTSTDPDTIRRQIERLHQTLGALDTDLKGLIDHGRRVSQGMAQLERQAKEIEGQVTQLDSEVQKSLPTSFG